MMLVADVDIPSINKWNKVFKARGWVATKHNGKRKGQEGEG
jgi:hypothetical protein